MVVSDFGMWNRDGTLETFIWQISWRRELFDWEKDLKKQLMDLITNTHWNRDKSDEWSWVGENVTAYIVQSGYRTIKEVQDVLQSDCFRVIWDISVPGTIKVFGWRVMLDRQPSKVNLENKGVMVSCNLCPLCKKEVETTHHLFITCEVAHRLWIKCDNWVGITSVRHNDIANHFCSFYINDLSKKLSVYGERCGWH